MSVSSEQQGQFELFGEFWQNDVHDDEGFEEVEHPNGVCVVTQSLHRVHPRDNVADAFLFNFKLRRVCPFQRLVNQLSHPSIQLASSHSGLVCGNGLSLAAVSEFNCHRVSTKRSTR